MKSMKSRKSMEILPGTQYTCTQEVLEVLEVQGSPGSPRKSGSPGSPEVQEVLEVLEVQQSLEFLWTTNNNPPQS
jgi:hypothetical protein